MPYKFNEPRWMAQVSKSTARANGWTRSKEVDDVGDVSAVPDLLGQIASRVVSLTADGAYDVEQSTMP
jgi:hypothetical protein